MGYTAVHKIKANGEVENVGEARSSHGWCTHVWSTMADKYGVDVRGFKYEPPWAMFGKPPMSERDSIVMGARSTPCGSSAPTFRGSSRRWSPSVVAGFGSAARRVMARRVAW